MKNLTVYIQPENKAELPCVLCAIRAIFRNHIEVKPIEMGYTQVSIDGYPEELSQIEEMLSPLV